jgi:predicted HTH transcriptional regulator
MDGDADFILAIRIFYREDKVVADVSGNVFTRVGDEKRKLGDEEVRELQNDKGQVDLEQEPSNVPYPADFDGELLRKFCEGVKKTRQLLTDHTKEEILVNQRLGKIKAGKFHPNNACV